MGLRRIALAPLYWLAGWVDDNPISAVGLVIAVGALAVFLATISLGSSPETGALALDSNTAGILAETARERPAYLAAAIVGVVVALLYDG
jgi:hypothetical protein